MEFITPSFIDTTTGITVDSNTLTVENVLNPDLTFQYITDDYANDLTTGSITFDFGSTQTVERIALMGMNLKEFDIYYDGVTANAFALTGPTVTSSWLNNSESSIYLFTDTISCQTVTIDMKATQTANQEKALGYAIFSQQKLDFERIPAAKNFSTRVHNLGEKWETKIKFKYIEMDFRDDLYSVYNEHSPFMFAAFPTATSWDGIFYECVWSGKFDFFKWSDDAINAGYSGSINLKET